LLTITTFGSHRFMQSDPWWGLAMAVNVYMVFFLAANPVSFRKYLWVYCVICFGAPALPAVILLFIHDQGKGSVYGNATVSSSSLSKSRCRMRFKFVFFQN
jgi:hypothetical protein